MERQQDDQTETVSQKAVDGMECRGMLRLFRQNGQIGDARQSMRRRVTFFVWKRIRVGWQDKMAAVKVALFARSLGVIPA